MTIGAAIRITSPDEGPVIEQAAAFAKRTGEPCFVIAIVAPLSHGVASDVDQRVMQHNLDLIEASHASPIILEGDDPPKLVMAGARAFGVRTLFVKNYSSGNLALSMAEELLHLAPPFDVVVVGSQ